MKKILSDLIRMKLGTKSGRILLAAFAGFILLTTVYSIIVLANIRFNDKTENSIRMETLAGNSLNEIKFLSVSNNIRLYVNYPAEDAKKYSMVPLSAVKTLTVKRIGDTLKILPMLFKGEKWYPAEFPICYVNLPEIEGVKGVNNSLIMLYQVNYKSIRLETKERAMIFLKAKTDMGTVNAKAVDGSRIDIDNCSNIIAELKNNSSLGVRSKSIKIKGIMRNRSYLEVQGEQPDLKELVRKDSAAVVFK